MKYKVDIEAFQGPMDLLLHLIDKSKIDIYDIPINSITEQFIEHIYKMEELNLEIASEFLIMAATLLEIKSKLLLPIEKNDDMQLEMDELDPRAELVRRLVEYKKFKNVSEELKSYEMRHSKVYYKPREEIMVEEKIEINLENLSIEMIVESINKMLKSRNEIDKSININEIQREEYTLEDCIFEIEEVLEGQERVLFSELLKRDIDKQEIITYFLSLLELIRMRKIIVAQEEDFSELIIYRRVEND